MNFSASIIVLPLKRWFIVLDNWCLDRKKPIPGHSLWSHFHNFLEAILRSTLRRYTPGKWTRLAGNIHIKKHIFNHGLVSIAMLGLPEGAYMYIAYIRVSVWIWSSPTSNVLSFHVISEKVSILNHQFSRKIDHRGFPSPNTKRKSLFLRSELIPQTGTKFSF